MGIESEHKGLVTSLREQGSNSFQCFGTWCAEKSVWLDTDLWRDSRQEMILCSSSVQKDQSYYVLAFWLG